MNQEHLGPPLRRLLCALLAAACLTIALPACGTPEDHSAGDGAEASVPPASTQPVNGSDSGVGQLQVSEQPWWQLTTSTPSSTQTPTPRTTITVALPGDVLFEADSPALTPGATSQLTALQARYLSKDPHATLTVTGHTDRGPSGQAENATTAKSLSLARASAIKAWLVAHGTPSEAITVGGVGDSQPLYPSDSPAHMAANRRCDFTITTTAA